MEPVSIGAAIVAFITALPKIIDMISGLGRIMAQKKFQDWMNEMNQVTKDLENAQTTEQRVEAARRLARLTSGGV